jgi:AraC-like DNA-binding protein
MQPRTPATQRSDSLAPLPELLSEFGVALDDVLRGTGLSADDILPGRFIPYAAYLAILERAVDRTGREDFGLLLGRRQTLATVGPLAVAVQSSATLGEALADFTGFQISNSSGAATYLHRRDDMIFLGYGTHDPTLTVSPYAHDIVLAVMAMMLRALTGGAVRAVEFSAMRWKPADPRPWQRLGAPVRFGETETGCYISVRDMSRPLPSANRPARDEALRKLAVMTGAAPWGWAGRTRHGLRAIILEGRSGMPEVARHLDIGPRTLRRALSREGTTFEEIRDAVRLAMAQELLTMSSLAISDLALTLDYATPSAFINAFRRWTGQSPAAWRNDRRRTLLASH